MQELRGILLMVAAVGTFVLMDTTAKYLSRWYPVPLIVWARYAANLVVLLAFLAATGQLERLRTARPGLQLARGVLLVLATLLFFTSLSVLPLADANAIGFALPLFVAALAVPMLGERLEMPRLIAIFVGLAGALAIVRPGSDVFTPYALLPLGMAACNALYQILTRKVAGLEHPLTSLVWGAVVGAVLMSLAAPFVWATPQAASHGALIVVIGVLASVGHFLLIKAYEHASATLLAPYTYSALVWAMLMGWLVFGDFPDGWSLAGMGIIVASGLYLANRQRYAVRGG
ncbi:MAG TPA: DMT family transporter [Burkholderiales bacterium]|jgi:drug/metabolite transporter (DMT)-like permease|nr:DMT family transporter [Burkholderiales bacterium]